MQVLIVFFLNIKQVFLPESRKNGAPCQATAEMPEKGFRTEAPSIRLGPKAPDKNMHAKKGKGVIQSHGCRKLPTRNLHIPPASYHRKCIRSTFFENITKFLGCIYRTAIQEPRTLSLHIQTGYATMGGVFRVCARQSGARPGGTDSSKPSCPKTKLRSEIAYEMEC